VHGGRLGGLLDGHHPSPESDPRCQGRQEGPREQVRSTVDLDEVREGAADLRPDDVDEGRIHPSRVAGEQAEHLDRALAPALPFEELPQRVLVVRGHDGPPGGLALRREPLGDWCQGLVPEVRRQLPLLMGVNRETEKGRVPGELPLPHASTMHVCTQFGLPIVNGDVRRPKACT
jgi:hypothetical protein